MASEGARTCVWGPAQAGCRADRGLGLPGKHDPARVHPSVRQALSKEAEEVAPSPCWGNELKGQGRLTCVRGLWTGSSSDQHCHGSPGPCKGSPLLRRDPTAPSVQGPELWAGARPQPTAPLCTLTLEHGGQLPHPQAPDGRVLAQGALQQEERDPRKDERQEVGDQEGPCGVEKRDARGLELLETRSVRESITAGRSGVPATISLYSALKAAPKAKVRPEDVLCSRSMPCTLQNEDGTFRASLTEDYCPLGILWKRTRSRSGAWHSHWRLQGTHFPKVTPENA